eukprot:TRINITY_DN42263_c0_g1_i1.p1 TRINITY_DN42263_c0_g1~~TRINITY_DN42263_c0_g1_i1.p1  ORF type:complete len:263 (+),score=29.97 TRINITY_DN42263_c0_g1_i1:197-985(+)
MVLWMCQLQRRRTGISFGFLLEALFSMPLIVALPEETLLTMHPIVGILNSVMTHFFLFQDTDESQGLVSDTALILETLAGLVCAAYWMLLLCMACTLVGEQPEFKEQLVSALSGLVLMNGLFCAGCCVIGIFTCCCRRCWNSQRHETEVVRIKFSTPVFDDFALRTFTLGDEDACGRRDELLLYSTCCICLDEMQRNDIVSELPCKHFFHRKCIEAWYGSKRSLKSCPMRCNVSKPEPCMVLPVVPAQAESTLFLIDCPEEP